MASNFTAAPQALGYIYQLRYALYVLLSGAEESEVSVEKADDIAIDKGDSYQVLQLKRINKSIAITDRSLELWKTIRVWSELIKSGQVNLSITKFFLVSTSNVPEDSIAYLLRSGKFRNHELAYQKLIIESVSNQNAKLTKDTLLKCFDSFKSLGENNQKKLVESIEVLDAALDIFDVPTEIQKRFFTSVRREYRKALYERLEGWWFDKMINHLGNTTSEKAIPRYEVEDKIADLAEQFQPEALPIDFFGKFPEIPSDADGRMFVIQLSEIEVSSQRIEKAVQDYYKAVAQRSRWARDGLLFGDELEKFDAKLVDEWERFSLALLDDVSDKENEKDLKKCGQKIFNHMELNTDHLRIREKVSESYVKSGSYHILADNLNGNPRVWWHPLFMQKIKKVIAPGE